MSGQVGVQGDLLRESLSKTELEEDGEVGGEWVRRRTVGGWVTELRTELGAQEGTDVDHETRSGRSKSRLT